MTDRDRDREREIEREVDRREVRREMDREQREQTGGDESRDDGTREEPYATHRPEGAERREQRESADAREADTRETDTRETGARGRSEPGGEVDREQTEGDRREGRGSRSDRGAARRSTSWISVVLGLLAALGTGVVLGAIVGGLLGASAVGAVIGFAVTVFVAYLIGGYVAGRMAGRSGAKHGLLVALLALGIAIVLAILGAIAGTALVQNPSSVSLPSGVQQQVPQNLGGLLTATGITGLILPFIGGPIGGALGARSARRTSGGSREREERDPRGRDSREGYREGDDRRSRVEHPPAPRDMDEREIFVDVLRIVVSILLPPLGVFWQVGLSGQFWINVLLTILGYVPGLAHAVYIILTRRG